MNFSPSHAARKHMRAKIRHAAFTRMPIWLSGGRLRQSKSVSDIHEVHRDIVLPDMAAALDGLRITHLSDLHVGHVLEPDALPQIMHAANAMGGDLIAVTGDFIDLSLHVLDQVIEALLLLKAPLGVYLVLGNHDKLVNGAELSRRFEEAGLNLLVNQRLMLRCGTESILLAGIDFAPRKAQLARMVHRTFARWQDGDGQDAAPVSRDPESAEGSASGVPSPSGGACAPLRQVSASRLIRTAPQQQPALRLLLSHHPKAFDAGIRHHVDLTLAGHTHGGQVVVANTRGRRGLIGLGSLGFRYPRGLYRKGHHYLYVTTGVGSWFPLRVKCPAEIACLTLRRKGAMIRELHDYKSGA